MTEVGYYEAKRWGIVDVIAKLQAYYADHNKSFADLDMETLYDMGREVDRKNRETSGFYSYKSCIECDKYRDMLRYQSNWERQQNKDK